MLWTSDRKRAFRTALLDSYRSYSALQIFVSDAVDTNLEVIGSRSEGLDAVVFKLVEWADAKKHLSGLHTYFCKDNPRHEFSQGLEESDRASTSITPPVDRNRIKSQKSPTATQASNYVDQSTNYTITNSENVDFSSSSNSGGDGPWTMIGAIFTVFGVIVAIAFGVLQLQGTQEKNEPETSTLESSSSPIRRIDRHKGNIAEIFRTVAVRL
ncbi:MAG: effector-associated domain EAD1-containing protein [Cyanobacteria bacterium P01_C01_bin.89]